MITRPIGRSVARDVSRSILGEGVVDPDADLRGAISRLMESGGGLWTVSPTRLGEQQLFQDEAMTIPVSTDGDPVRVVKDLSGNDHHLVAPSSSARPVYRVSEGVHWLEADGVDDGFMIANTSTDFQFTGDYTYQVSVLSLSANTLWLYEKESGGPWNTLITRAEGYIRSSSTTSSEGTIDVNSASNFPLGVVFSASVRKLGSDLYVGVDGSESEGQFVGATSTYTTQSAAMLYRGNGSFFFSGRFYGGFVAGLSAQTSDMALVDGIMKGSY